MTGFTAVPEYQIPGEAELMSRHGISPADYERDAKNQAEIALQPIADLREKDFRTLYQRIVSLAPDPIGLGERWKRAG